MTLLGWVHRVRDLGALVFLDVRDRDGLTQVVFSEGHPALDTAKHLRAEFVIGVTGTVRARAADAVNPRMATGEVEVAADELRVLNEAAVPPFQIDRRGGARLRRSPAAVPLPRSAPAEAAGQPPACATR